MFPLQLQLHVLFFTTVLLLSHTIEAKKYAANEVDFETCCSIGGNLTRCSDQGLDKSFHEPPTGICRSVMKLCCLLNHESQMCDKDFISTSFEQFCTNPSPKYENCCTACQIGEEFGGEKNVSLEQFFEKFENLDNQFVRDLIKECSDRKKRHIVDFETCRAGFFFNRAISACQDLNECNIENNGCVDGQVCVNSIGSYTCVPRSICRTGFKFNPSKVTCEKDDCETVFEITIRELDPIDANGDSFTMESKSTKTIQKISCLPGYEFNLLTRTCVDIDECRLKLDNCDHFCANIPGSFRCHCRRGFTTNGSSCFDIDECSMKKQHCSHSCKNVKGSFRCGCPKGLRLGVNKKTCEDVDECTEKRGVCYKRICNNLIGNFICHKPSCPNGFRVYHFTRRNNFNKCVRNHCEANDQVCLDKPKYLTFKNVSLLGTSMTVKRSIILHNIDLTRFKFTTVLKLLSVTKSKGVIPIEKDFFKILIQPTRALVLLAKPITEHASVQIILNIEKESRKVVEKVEINLTVQSMF